MKKIYLSGSKSKSIRGLKHKSVQRDVPFDCPDDIAASLLSQNGMFREVKENKKSNKIKGDK